MIVVFVKIFIYFYILTEFKFIDSKKMINPKTLLERLKESCENFGIVIGPKTASTIFLVGTCLSLYSCSGSTGENGYREKIISQLIPQIEMLDNKPGISLQDLAAAGLPTFCFAEGREINLSKIPISYLEQALEKFNASKFYWKLLPYYKSKKLNI